MSSRLLASPDARTLSSTFVLILNCVHDSVPRTYVAHTWMQLAGRHRPSDPTFPWNVQEDVV